MKKIIVILGMHRSGTSMIAGILNMLGIDMGKELIGKHWSNPLGHFENKKFLELNEKILRKAGGVWNRPPEEEQILAQVGIFSEEIKNLIQSNESKFWGWKDPRTSLTIELFLPYLDNPYFLVCHRDASAIARSLKRRDNMRLEQGIKLTKIYNKRIERFFKMHNGLNRLDLFYEKITSNPKEGVEKIVDYLEIQPSEQVFQKALYLIVPREQMQKISKEMRKTEKQQKIKNQIKEAIANPKIVQKAIFKWIITQLGGVIKCLRE